MTFIKDERQRLADSLEAAGPDAPTLNEGWKTRDLLEHLVLREIYPLHALGAKIPGNSLSRTRVDQVHSMDWQKLLATFRGGRQVFNPLQVGAVDRLVNTAEYVIHHEDILRANPSLPNRELSDAEQYEVFQALKGMAPLLTARLRVAVEVVTQKYPTFTAAFGPNKHETVTISGTPLEVLMYLSGRRDNSEANLTGTDHAVELLKTGKLGF